MGHINHGEQMTSGSPPDVVITEWDQWVEDDCNIQAESWIVNQ